MFPLNKKKKTFFKHKNCVCASGRRRKKRKRKKKKKHVHETHVQVHIDIFVRIVQLLAPDDMKQKVNSGVLADYVPYGDRLLSSFNISYCLLFLHR